MRQSVRVHFLWTILGLAPAPPARPDGREQLRRWLLSAYWLCWLTGIIACLARPQPLAAGGATAGYISGALFGLLMLALIGCSVHDGREAAWLALATTVGAGAEGLSLATGWPFGHYRYTELVLPQFHGWPPLLGLAWAEFAWYAWHVFSPLHRPRWLLAPLGAAWMTAMDLVMDPVAAGPLRFWVWRDGGPYYGVPWQNFAGWFIVSAAILACALAVMRKPPLQAARPVTPAISATPLALGLSILLWFTLLAARHGMWIPVVIGIVLLVIHCKATPINNRLMSR